ncbi:hypothetical protein AMECASPLE_020248 [Ameca splendens]|uniref:Uncharacterized protein n=1 Tax=Ameca splendens TaxID=208324 RepID=A0ABV0XS46_9TELE
MHYLVFVFLSLLVSPNSSSKCYIPGVSLQEELWWLRYLALTVPSHISILFWQEAKLNVTGDRCSTFFALSLPLTFITMTMFRYLRLGLSNHTGLSRVSTNESFYFSMFKRKGNFRKRKQKILIQKINLFHILKHRYKTIKASLSECYCHDFSKCVPRSS